MPFVRFLTIPFVCIFKQSSYPICIKSIFSTIFEPFGSSISSQSVLIGAKDSLCDLDLVIRWSIACRSRYLCDCGSLIERYSHKHISCPIDCSSVLNVLLKLDIFLRTPSRRRFVASRSLIDLNIFDVSQWL